MASVMIPSAVEAEHIRPKALVAGLSKVWGIRTQQEAAWQELAFRRQNLLRHENEAKLTTMAAIKCKDACYIS